MGKCVTVRFWPSNPRPLIQVLPAQVLLAGGSSEYCASAMSPAAAVSYLVDVTPGANHSIVQEDTAFPRVVRPPMRQAHIASRCIHGIELCHMCTLQAYTFTASTSQADVFKTLNMPGQAGRA